MRKSFLSVLVAVLCLLGLNGCDGSIAGNTAPIVGEWTAAGVLYDEKIYSFEDVPALADLYDYETITINADGTYSRLTHVWVCEGLWENFAVEGYDDAYKLKRQSIRQVGKDSEVADDVKVAFILEADSNVMVLMDTDDDDETTQLLFLRNGTSSSLLSGGDSTSYNTNESNGMSSNDNRAATAGERNALQMALDYLNYSAFSYQGLIDQLEYEGFTYSEAKYGVDNCGADWYEQAAKMAKQYLDYSSFSRSGLIDQLEYEGFTYKQAVYGVDKVY